MLKGSPTKKALLRGVASKEASPLMDTEQAATYIKKSASWLNKERAQGRGPRVVRIGGSARYRKEDLDQFISDCTQEASETQKGAA